MTIASYNLGDSEGEFLSHINFDARNAMKELLKGKTINPRDQSTRSSLSRYARLGLVSKVGNRYPNTSFTINPDSQDIESWLQLWQDWRDTTQDVLRAQSQIRPTYQKLDRLARIVEEKSKWRFGVNIDLEIVNGIRKALIKSDRTLPKTIFTRTTLFGQDFYTITQDGASRFLHILTSFSPILLEQAKAELARKRSVRVALKTRRTTLGEKDKLLKKIGFYRRFEHLSSRLPEDVAMDQAQWECFRALFRCVDDPEYLAPWANVFDVSESTIKYSLRVAKQKPPIEHYLNDQKDLLHLSRLISLRKLRQRAARYSQPSNSADYR